MLKSIKGLTTMILNKDDFGNAFFLKAVKTTGKKIHLVNTNQKGKPIEDSTLCCRGLMEIEDEEEVIEDIDRLEAILLESDICKQCKKDVRIFVEDQIVNKFVWRKN